MIASPISPVYFELVDYLAEKATAEEILAFRVSESMQQRADELTEHNKEGRLTAEESAELEQMLEFDEIIALLKAKALRALKNS
jgi:hypothetical protein